jgi:class 3 adenylate cyclase
LEAAATACEEAARRLASVREPAGLPDMLQAVRGMLAWRRGDSPQGEQLLTEAIGRLQQQALHLETIPYLYDLRDLYAASSEKETRTKAVLVMSHALSLFTELGADQAIEEVEEWIRSVDSPRLTRLILERQLPEHLVPQIMDGKLKRPESRRQKVTVLFSDIRGYSRLSEDLEPEEVVDLLNAWLTEATRTIRRHGGVIDKFIGDAVMAVFGVPEPHPEDAARAVRAALELREALFSLNLRHKALGRKTLRIGIGIHTGDAVLGYLGSHLHQSYTVIGDAVNVASRLESATKDYDACDILISHETQQEQERFDVAVTRPLGMQSLQNREQPLAIYKVLEPRKSVVAHDS